MLFDDFKCLKGLAGVATVKSDLGGQFLNDFDQVLSICCIVSISLWVFALLVVDSHLLYNITLLLLGRVVSESQSK